MAGRRHDASGRDSVTEHIVYTHSTDGLPLEGVVISPTRQPAEIAVVWIHGGASKFYEPHYLAIGHALARCGYPFVSGNTRGHDGFTLLWRGDEVVLGGAVFERFDQSPYDLAAWLRLAAELGVRGVVLAGHSLGASKIAYYGATEDDDRILGLIAASPPVGWESIPERVALAEQLVSAGHGEDLLPHLEGSPPWNIVSAQMVATRERILRHAFDSGTETPYIARARCPLLLLHGSEERIDPAWLETVRGNASPTWPLDISVINGAGHEYTGVEEQVAGAIAGWIAARL